MILQQAIMQLSQKDKIVPKLVMLHECGLAIHKGDKDTMWVVSHFNSGKYILKYIKERKKAEEYIERLINILPSWHFTLKEFDENEWKINKTRLKPIVDTIQKEILQKEV